VTVVWVRVNTCHTCRRLCSTLIFVSCLCGNRRLAHSSASICWERCLWVLWVICPRPRTTADSPCPLYPYHLPETLCEFWIGESLGRGPKRFSRYFTPHWKWAIRHFPSILTQFMAMFDIVILKSLNLTFIRRKLNIFVHNLYRCKSTPPFADSSIFSPGEWD